MGTLMIGISLGLLTSGAVAFLFDIGHPVACYMARRAAKRLPATVRDEVLEQWLGDIHAMPSSAGKLWIACGLFGAGNKLAENFAAERKQPGSKRHRTVEWEEKIVTYRTRGNVRIVIDDWKKG